MKIHRDKQKVYTHHTIQVKRYFQPVLALLLHSMPLNCARASFFSSWFPGFSLGWQIAIDHGYSVWHISAIFTTAVHLPTCVPAKTFWFTELLNQRNFACPHAATSSVPTCISEPWEALIFNISHKLLHYGSNSETTKQAFSESNLLAALWKLN